MSRPPAAVLAARLIVLSLLTSLSIVSTGCGASLMKLPAGAPTAAPDLHDALTEATLACRAIATMDAVISVRGSVGDQKLRADLITGVASPASALLEAVAVGRSFFIFVARNNDATLLLKQENPNRVLEHGVPSDVLEAVTGVPVDPATLRTMLTGCPSLVVDGNDGGQLQDNLRVVSDVDGLVYLKRPQRNVPWRLVAATHKGLSGSWRAEYRDFVNDLPRSIHLKSDDPKKFDLTLALKDVRINGPIGDEVFRLQIPPTADPITLDELRRSGPLGAAPSSRGANGH